jgi:hypothetical protein
VPFNKSSLTLSIANGSVTARILINILTLKLFFCHRHKSVLYCNGRSIFKFNDKLTFLNIIWNSLATGGSTISVNNFILWISPRFPNSSVNVNIRIFNTAKYILSDYTIELTNSIFIFSSLAVPSSSFLVANGTPSAGQIRAPEISGSVARSPCFYK